MLSEQKKSVLKQKITENHHEIYVISLEKLERIAKASLKSPYALAYSVAKESWPLLKTPSDLAANWGGAVKDTINLGKLLNDLGIPRGVITRAYVKNYGGKPHIILKGDPRLRTILTGTKYGLSNPKVVTMGLGTANVVKGTAYGGVFTMVLLTGFRIADFVLNDEATLTRLIGSLATDVVKVGIATGASMFAAAFAGAITTIAIGPLVVSIAIGVAVSFSLSWLDERYHITDRVVKKLDEISDDINSGINKNIDSTINREISKQWSHQLRGL